ncbi:N-ethylmaleimide reductase [Methylopila capsulata]|uniref:Alkene reductase n=1 Tax=Methylopila capsulata TaxID=61654 RepID=A0A9W6IRN8_9HYPH|nr:alkene reductase [Methylopila capsulata]MBM7849985.1 N-ethylmaleimide reductase [Methylopila capsulata]GLK55277.1 alkene reductase [Methylopila capsulata]
MTDTLDLLFKPLKAGALDLRNRIVMAPLTRSRADHKTLAPRQMNADYYGQRASAGLIIAEATQIMPEGQGYAWTPGIYSDEQIAGWKLVTDAVHAKGGTIVLQLWHVGRISHRDLQPGGKLPVAPSAVKPEGKAFTETGFKDLETPRALELDEIPGIVAQYGQAAKNAVAAGFDGVEVHGANGYLLDQFLRDKTNLRTDAYGGSIQNRARFLLEATQAAIDAIGKERVGIRLSPVSPANDCADSNPEPLFTYVTEKLSEMGLAFLHVIEGETRGSRAPAGAFDLSVLRRAFKGVYIGNNGYDPALAATRVAAGEVDAVAFGRPFIANPDLVERIRDGAALAKPDEATFYGGDAKGYVDYPTYREAEAKVA